ncbi:MAG: valine--tRNA ligase [Actinobacteria bacterium]|nr:valine--tRNA ligase [Actinomycetota bacterium]
MSKGRQTEEQLQMEADLRDLWEIAAVYHYDGSRGRDETFVVDTPPPTASGSLHIGHCMSYTHPDLIVRFKRMQGLNIFYPMGWDDNGLPTERRVQNVFGIRCDPSLPYDPDLQLEWGRQGDQIPVSRQNFIEACGVVVEEDEKKFKELFERLGLSVDWRQTYATIDERCRFVAQLSFLRLLEEGEAELRQAPTMWDVDYQSAIAQAEIEDREREGEFYKIRFAVDGGDGFTIATTRPELLPACIAVVAHPDDERYKELIGKTAVTPLFRAPVPILADDNADPEKGTGILMVCTFGDTADVEKWREMGVPAREVIGLDGRIKAAPWGEGHWETHDAAAASAAHEQLAGSFVNQARRRIVEVLGEAGALAGEPEKIRRPVKFYERGERPLEFVVTRQWFIKVLDKKEALLEQGRKIAWHPEHMRRRYEDWVEGLNLDWNVSRQRYFGVPIPVWYEVDADGKVDHSKTLRPEPGRLPIDPSQDVPDGYDNSQRGQPGGFVGDPDIFDTWATSSLTPIITTPWPEESYRELYPNDLRPQAHEIIRTWAFYTITRAMLEDGSIPWSDIAISGFVVDPDRKKMSKSKGNVVIPTEPLDEFGADAVRYWAASARLGIDATFDTNVLKEGKRLVTKIRNASRLVLGYEGEAGPPTHALDAALIERLARVVEEATERMTAYDHSGALGAIETWFWSDFCDNFLELTKNRAYAGDASAIGTLRRGIDVALRLFAPFVPYVTEEVWQQGQGAPRSIHAAPWPKREELADGMDDGSFEAAVAVLTEIRKAKSEAKVSMRTPVEHLDVRGPGDRLELLKKVLDDIVSTGNVKEQQLSADGDAGLTVTVRLGEPERRA